jgi:hypothetical protein
LSDNGSTRIEHQNSKILVTKRNTEKRFFQRTTTEKTGRRGDEDRGGLKRKDLDNTGGGLLGLFREMLEIVPE